MNIKTEKLPNCKSKTCYIKKQERKITLEIGLSWARATATE